MSILAIAFLMISLVVIWNTANWLNKIDRQRSEAEDNVKLMNAKLEKRVGERSAMFQESEEKSRYFTWKQETVVSINGCLKRSTEKLLII